MKEELVKQLLYTSVHKNNILPLTTRCNVSCIFCSHGQNPPDIEAVAIPPLSWGDLEDMVIFLSPQNKVILGESATRIMEGEPFTHPRCIEVLQMIRRNLPETLIQITTNGTLLTKEKVKALKELEPLEIVISLNSSTVEKRQVLMNDRCAASAIKAVQLLADQSITFHGSMVTMPWVTGYEDIKSTITFLEQHGAETIRTLLPGFTRHRKKGVCPRNTDLVPEPGWEDELIDFLKQCRAECTVPITIEPLGLHDLKPTITGVIANSRSAEVGLKKGDLIKSINGEVPFSRTEAFYQLKGPGRYTIEIASADGCNKDVVLPLGKEEKSGLVMDYDISLRCLEEIVRAMGPQEQGSTLILASEFGAPLLQAGLKKILKQDDSWEVVAVKNHSFGGNIRAAGLLLVEDFSIALAKISSLKKPDVVLLPAIAFDEKGKDLRGISYTKLSSEYNIIVKIVNCF